MRQEGSSAQRYNSGKLRWDLIDWESVEEMVRVLEKGAERYAPDNWKKGLHREEMLESIQRHLVALFKKEEIDSDPGFLTHHMGNIMCGAMFYLYHYRNKSFSKERNNPFKSKQDGNNSGSGSKETVPFT